MLVIVPRLDSVDWIEVKGLVRIFPMEKLPVAKG
jgi:hypothetical protein